MGEWDKVSIAYGYQDFPAGTDEGKALAAILDGAWKKDLLYLSNQDIEANPRVDQWSNGTDAAAGRCPRRSRRSKASFPSLSTSSQAPANPAVRVAICS